MPKHHPHGSPERDLELPLLGAGGHRRSLSEDTGSPSKPPKVVVISPTKKKSKIWHRDRTPASENAALPEGQPQPKSRFQLPLLSSTPLNQGIFHHKRRASAGGEAAKTHKTHKASLITPTSEGMGLFQRLTNTKNGGTTPTTKSPTPPIEEPDLERGEELEDDDNTEVTLRLGPTTLQTVDELSSIPDVSDVSTRKRMESSLTWTPQEELSLFTAPTTPSVRARSVRFSEGALTPGDMQSVFARLEQGESIYEEEDEPSHSFLAQDRDLYSMERSLLALLEDFRSGKLRSLRDDTLEQMRAVREQQERLARLHFDLYTQEDDTDESQNDATQSESAEDTPPSDGKFKQLSEGLRDLQESIQCLCAIEELST